MTTFAPQPGAAPVLRQVAAQASMEARLMLRNGEQLLLALVIPVIVLVGGVAGADRVGLDFSRPTVDILTPGVLALAVMSTAFTSLAKAKVLQPYEVTEAMSKYVRQQFAAAISGEISSKEALDKSVAKCNELLQG